MADKTFDQLWYCEKCGADTGFKFPATTDSLEVKESILKQHRQISPKCPANSLPPIRFRQVERPQGKGT
jgi:hypothetical protein